MMFVLLLFHLRKQTRTYVLLLCSFLFIHLFMGLFGPKSHLLRLSELFGMRLILLLLIADLLPQELTYVHLVIGFIHSFSFIHLLIEEQLVVEVQVILFGTKVFTSYIFFKPL